eukprot:gene31147-6287_t
MPLFGRLLLPSDTPFMSDTLFKRASIIRAHLLETHPKLSSNEECVFEYARFLLLKTYKDDVGVPPVLAPSEDVDQVWHAHLMLPHLYMQLCEELGMGVIAHDPDTALDIDKHNARLALTTLLYSDMFGHEAGHLWKEKNVQQSKRGAAAPETLHGRLGAKRNGRPAKEEATALKTLHGRVNAKKNGHQAKEEATALKTLHGRVEAKLNGHQVKEEAEALMTLHGCVEPKNSGHQAKADEDEPFTLCIEELTGNINQ